MKVLVDVLNRQRKIKISSKRLTQVTRKIIRLLYQLEKFNKFDLRDYKFLTISVVLVGKEKMKKINFRYRGKNYNTDVLAFPYLDYRTDSKEFYIGEILINPEKVQIQARQYGVSLWQEINRLLIHGILHLLGYDHEISESQALAMRRMEEKILKELQT